MNPVWFHQVLETLPAAGNRDEATRSVASRVHTLASGATCIVRAKEGFTGTPAEVTGDVWTPLESSPSTGTRFISSDSHNHLVTEPTPRLLSPSLLSWLPLLPIL